MTATIRFFLIVMIAVSVISDALLMPFYPQFFQAAFSIDDPLHTGLYLSASCLVVMLAFPLWAILARRVAVIRLLIYTQFGAAVLSLLCYRVDSLIDFWIASLTMLVLKGSYLLIYPTLMSLEHKDRHAGTIGLLAVIVHLGAVLGAGAGGFVLEWFAPRQIFLLMAAGDFMQMLICLFLPANRLKAAEIKQQSDVSSTNGNVSAPAVLRLGLIMFAFYFSVFLIRPFFSRYWESISAWNGAIVSGFVFAIPGLMALLALTLKSGIHAKRGLAPILLWSIGGLLLQATQLDAAVLAGRCLFGWVLFKATVRLDLLLFETSSSHSYIADFSKIYFFQSLGALTASYAAAAIVAAYGLQATFLAAATGLAITVGLYTLLYKSAPKPLTTIVETP